GFTSAQSCAGTRLPGSHPQFISLDTSGRTMTHSAWTFVVLCRMGGGAPFEPATEDQEPGNTHKLRPTAWRGNSETPGSIALLATVCRARKLQKSSRGNR